MIKDPVKFFRNIGKTGLPGTNREAIMSVFNEFKDNWYTAKHFSEGLDMSNSFAYKICRGMANQRILDTRKQGWVVYYRFHKGDRID